MWHCCWSCRRHDGRPLGMTQDSLRIPHSGIMHVQRDPLLAVTCRQTRNGSPTNPGAGLPTFVGNSKAAMALAIDLQVIGMHQVDDVLHHGRVVFLPISLQSGPAWKSK